MAGLRSYIRAYAQGDVLVPDLLKEVAATPTKVRILGSVVIM